MKQWKKPTLNIFSNDTKHNISVAKMGCEQHCSVGMLNGNNDVCQAPETSAETFVLFFSWAPNPTSCLR